MGAWTRKRPAGEPLRRARPGLQPRTCSGFPRGGRSRQEGSLLESASEVFGVGALPGDPCGESKPQPDRADAPALRAAAPPPTTRPGRLPRSPPSRGLVSITTHGQTSGGAQPPPRGQDSRGRWSRATAQAYTAPGDQPAGQHRATQGAWEPVSTQREQNAGTAHKGTNGTDGPCWPGPGGTPPLSSSSRRLGARHRKPHVGCRGPPAGWGAAGLPARLWLCWHRQDPRGGEPRPRWARSLCPGL